MTNLGKKLKMMIAILQVKPIRKKKIEIPPVVPSEPPAKKINHSLWNKQTVVNYNEDLCNGDNEFALENMEWQNTSIDSSN